MFSKSQSVNFQQQKLNCPETTFSNLSTKPVGKKTFFIYSRISNEIDIICAQSLFTQNVFTFHFNPGEETSEFESILHSKYVGSNLKMTR